MQLRKLAASALGALMTGATLAFPAAAAGLADYPAPFVEGTDANFSIVVGEQAAPADVVSAIDVAVTLGGQPTMEETADVEGSTSWSAEEGLTLNKPNSNLYLNSDTDAGIDSLVEGDLGMLTTQTFTDQLADEEVEVVNEISIGSQSQAFDAPRGMDEISLHIAVPEVSDTDYLFSVDSYLDSAVEMNSTEMENEQVEMFGRTYEISPDTTDSELVLYGDSQTFEVERGEDHTFEVSGSEETVSVRYVPDSGDSVTFTYDGETKKLEEGETFDANGQEVRIRNIYPLGDGEGIVQFGVGSEEIVLEDTQPVEVDGEDVDGTYVDFHGGSVDALEEVSINFGYLDREEKFIEKGGMYKDPIFGIEFHYGGPEADAAEDAAESVEIVADGENAVLTMTDDSGDTADVTFVYDEEDRLGDIDGKISTYEGQELAVDDYVVLNIDENAEMYQVTDVFYDSGATGEPVELELVSVFGDDSITIDEDSNNGIVEKRINRETYTFDFTGTADTVQISDSSSETVLYPNLYTETDAAVSFTEEVTVDVATLQGYDTDNVTFRLPSTKSTNDEVVTIDANTSATTTVSAGGVTYDVSGNFVDPASADTSLTIAPTDSVNPSAMVIQPEGEGNEVGFLVTTTDAADTVDDDDVEITSSEVSGLASAGFGWKAFEETDDLSATYTHYGTYAELDTDDEGELTINFPEYESTVGMAVTGEDGSISATGGGSVTYERSVPITSAIGKLDTEVEEAAASEQHLILVGGPAVNMHVQSLLEDGKIVDADGEVIDTWTEDTPEIQLIEDAFSEGHTALVVAGWDKEDTGRAASSLQDIENLPEENVLDV